MIDFDISGHEMYQSNRIINSKNVRSSVLNILPTPQTYRDLIKYDIVRPCCYDDVIIICYCVSVCHRVGKSLKNLINKGTICMVSEANSLRQVHCVKMIKNIDIA